MLAFLKLLLAVFFVLLIVAFVGYQWIKKKIKGWWSGIVESTRQEMASAVPPFRIQLQRQESDNPNVLAGLFNPQGSKENQERVEELTEQLLALKFTRIGDFYSHEAFLGLRAFQHHDHQIFAIVYDHFAAGVWCDQYRRYDDKTSWTYVNKADELADRPPWSNAKYFPEATLEEILQALLADSPSTGILGSGADQFVKAFEAHYAKEMNWRITRGGVSEEEIRRVAERDGIEMTDEDVRRVQQPWKEAISDFLSERMLENWKTKSEQPAELFEAQQHRLVGVHKRMTPRKILAAVDDEYYDGAEEDEIESNEEVDEDDPKKWRQDLGMVERACGSGNPVAVFHAFLKKRQKTETFQLLGTVDRPIQGEIWLKPTRDEFHADEHEGIDVSDFDDIDA
jgi:hypothetical protein